MKCSNYKEYNTTQRIGNLFNKLYITLRRFSKHYFSYEDNNCSCPVNTGELIYQFGLIIEF